jgi:hypothetical protein
MALRSMELCLHGAAVDAAIFRTWQDAAHRAVQALAVSARIVWRRGNGLLASWQTAA